MANGSSSPSEEYSYGEKEYYFIDSVPSYMTCEICQGVLKESKTTVCCGHGFCTSCINKARERSQACPICRAESYEVNPDKKTDRHVKQLKVECRYKRKGCGWTGELSEVEGSHIEKNCPFAPVLCPQECGKKIARSDIEDHATNVCVKRKVKCEHCDFDGTFEVYQNEHLDSDEECPYRLVDCPFAQYGCQQVKKCELQEHEQSAMQNHLKVLSEFQQKEMKKLKSEVEELRTQLKHVEVLPKTTIARSQSLTVARDEQTTDQVQKLLKDVRELTAKVESQEKELKKIQIFKTRADYSTSTSDEYVNYVSTNLKKGMLVRACEDYEGIKQGDIGIFLQSNTLKPPAQFKWLLYGNTYWIFWDCVEILPWPAPSKGQPRPS